MSDLRERVAMAMKLAADDPSPVSYWYTEADAAISLVRAEVLEEAARCAEKSFGEGYHIAEAIRALKDRRDIS